MSTPTATRGGKTHYVSLQEIENAGPDAMAELSRNLKVYNDLYVIQGFSDTALIDDMKRYLHNIGTHSLPSYQPLEEGRPDFHRVVDNDERSYVKGIFHQYSFHPWNQNIFDLHNRFRKLYHIKNQTSNLDDAHYLYGPYTDFVPRIGFHHYPVGGGYLTTHADPVGEHQVAVPTLQMSQKGRDFTTGGLFYVDGLGNKQYVDDLSECGDVVLFNAETIHGVDPIDPDEPGTQWRDIRGRWMLLAAIVRTSSNVGAQDSVEVKNL